MKPPTYDGKTSWANYLKQFEAAARTNGWNNAEKASALTVALRGDAVNILQAIRPEEEMDYEQLVKRLEMRYGHAHLEEVYHTQLKNRCQKSGESLQEFEADIARLVRLAYPTGPDDFLESWAVRIFVDGIRDGETQQALRLARPKKLVDALAHALEFEAAKQASRGNHRVRDLNCDIDETTDLHAQVQRLVDEALKAKRQPRCWNCGELGHLRSRCRKQKKEEAGNHTQQEN